MKKILIIEPDRTIAKCIKQELEKRSIKADVAVDAKNAIDVADSLQPDAVVSEISLAGHSGSEFLYEFRTYSDWSDLPVIIYSSIKIPDEIRNSNDWKQLKITEFIYKPEETLEQLANVVESVLD